MDNEQTSRPMIEALDAAKSIVTVLQPLPVELQQKALKIAAEILGIGTPVPERSPAASPAPAPEGVLRYSMPTYETLADLFHVTDPASEADRALVTGYWLQVRGTEPDFDAQTVNTALKDLGHRVSNITQAFNYLIDRRPQLVIQTKKSGTSKQARKRYKLTSAGLAAVQQMIGGGERPNDPLP